MERTIRLDSLSHSRNQISMIFAVDNLRFETAYWYGGVDLLQLEERYGAEFMQKVFFHIMAFEANKLVSLAPTAIDLGPFTRFHTEAFEALWKKIVHHVWSEWRYKHNLPNYPGPAFTSTPTEPSSEELSSKAVETAPGDVSVLNFCGGGKDSLVAMKLLERGQIPYSSFAYSHSIYGPAKPQHALINQLLEHGHAAKQHQLYVYDSFVNSPILELCPEYGAKSITAAETPSSLFAVLPIILQDGYQHVALGHERSANVGNLVWSATGEEVNHQWGKSYEAEQLLNTYLQNELVRNFSYFSILQPVYDTVIFNLLRTDSNAVQDTHSCNIRKPWCCRCPKCAYVWLNYTAWLDTDLVNAIFNVNLFDLEENQLSFYQMLGLSEHTPFECIGQINEARLAFELCYRKGLTGKAMDTYKQHFPELDIEPILKEYLSVQDTETGIPSAIAQHILPQMHRSAAEAREYVERVELHCIPSREGWTRT